MLLIDLGNTCLKWRSESSQGSFVHKNNELKHLLAGNLGSLPAPKKIFFSNVAGAHLETILNTWSSEYWPQTKIIVAQVKNPMSLLSTNYDSENLGVDRWLSMLVLSSDKKKLPCIVIDCGSAITIDLVNSKSVHLGGVIMPGLNMSLSSLISGVDAIQQAKTSATTVLATTTEHAVVAGCLNALAAGIDVVVGKMKHEIDESDVNCYLTGGDADRIYPLLQSTVLPKPDLVLDGLQKYAELHES